MVEDANNHKQIIVYEIIASKTDGFFTVKPSN